MTRSLFNVTVHVNLDYPIKDENDYNDKANMMASAMHDVLATRESLASLTKATHMTVAHAECEIELVGDTLCGSAILDVEAADAILINKPILTKLFRDRLTFLGKVKVEKRSVEVPIPMIEST
jgi:DNA phosphorothioation-dependent restriction protein DptG